MDTKEAEIKKTSRSWGRQKQRAPSGQQLKTLVRVTFELYFTMLVILNIAVVPKLFYWYSLNKKNYAHGSILSTVI
ncbi:hypothetical protein K1719_027735 [Acacia pycnantha]|nr:hypothetical protein K1719_027735 [Acacia pycnantha]